jgi:protein TonB
MSFPWIAAAAVSVIAHVGFAKWVDDAEPRKKPRPPIEMTLAKLPPKVVEPPAPPPPPPPPEVQKPKRVTKVVKTVPQPPPPPETQRVGISEDATTDTGDVAVSTGVTTDGVLGTGTSMEKELPPPPPAPPAPPPPPPKPKFFPSYEVTKLPTIKKAVHPEIPDAFRQAQREALVVIEVEIDAKGKVVSARVMRHADHGLDDAALAAAKATEFEPALMGTTPVPVRYQLPYRFKVRG